MRSKFRRSNECFNPANTTTCSYLKQSISDLIILVSVQAIENHVSLAHYFFLVNVQRHSKNISADQVLCTVCSQYLS